MRCPRGHAPQGQGCEGQGEALLLADRQALCGLQQGTDRRKALLEYVQNVDPKVVTQFSEVAPATVVDAMRSTVSATSCRVRRSGMYHVEHFCCRDQRKPYLY